MKRYCLLLFILFCATNLWAQKFSVKGKVTDATGFGLPGVNVIEKGTTTGAVSAPDGTYEITISNKDAVLVYSFIGFVAQEVKVASQSTINVQLKEDAIGLEEVVAVGYGVQKKGDLTGSVEVVKADKLQKQAVFQTSQALQGVVPGLTVTQSSGQPGSDGASLRVRGIGSIKASNNPLVLIDGVEGDLNGVDASDIENISVLKDAGASAIYGSRASNGVILVTTKRAKAGKLTASYNGYVGFQDPTNVPEFIGALDYYKLIGDETKVQQYMDNPNDPDNYPNVNWADEMFSENGAMQYHSISLSGGSEKARVLASLSYQDQAGNLPNYNFNRYQGRVNSDFNLNKYIKLSLDINYRRNAKDSPLSGTRLRDAYRQVPFYAMQFSDGRWAWPPTGGNPVAEIRFGGIKEDRSDYLRAKMQIEIEPIKDLRIVAQYTPEYYNAFGSSWAPQYELYDGFDATVPTVQSYGNNNEAKLSKSYQREITENFSATISYSKEIGAHNFSVLGGYESILWEMEKFGAARYGYVLPDFPIMDNGSADNDSNSGSEDHYGLVSYFGRVNYSYDNRYLIGVNVRRDGSSRFASDSRWGVFPSFSAGWNIHNESFFPQNDVLTRVKLRGSWGQLGNQSINSNFPYASLISVGNSFYANGQIQQGAAQNVLSNDQISWEKAETTNVGFDFGFFGNSLSASVEYYDKKTKDLLGTQRVPYTTGLDAPIANVYSMKNSGIDFSLSYRGKVGELKYSFEGNFATLSNEVTDLNGVEFIKSGSSITQVGEAVSSIYGYETIGIFQNQDEIDNSPSQFGSLMPGDLKYKDQNTVDTDGDGVPDAPDGVINSDDRVILGNPFPNFTYGFNINAEYKGFDFSAAFSGIGGSSVYLREYLVWPLYNGGNAAQWMVDDAWTEENPNARYPKIRQGTSSNNYRTNSTYVYNTSYMRLRNLTIGYTIPERLVKKLQLSKVRLYVSGQNLLTFDKMPQGIDPTVPNNSNGGNYPLVKSYTFGISASF
ncbi:TonB-dependent receptor [Prolixibacteraceae bacterium JC049]|nr:TonB-dependent receptor [Prolixibacteraceae bacterium JC049]